MKIGIPSEIHAGEQRVATTPDVASQLIKLGYSVAIEAGAGAAAKFPDSDYEAAGCEVLASADDVWAQSDIIMKVRAPEQGEESKLRSDQTLTAVFSCHAVKIQLCFLSSNGSRRSRPIKRTRQVNISSCINQ